jgi:hypothetical protein
VAGQRTSVQMYWGVSMSTPFRLSAVLGAATLVLLLCSECSQQQLTQNSCVVHAASNFAGAAALSGQITVVQNGSPCEMALVLNSPSGSGFVSDPQVVTPPAHGTATARMSNGAAVMVYTPNHDYVGPDRFAVLFGPKYTLSVDVTVVAQP